MKKIEKKKLLYIADVCIEWDDKLTLRYLSDMRWVEILDLLEELNEDTTYKHTISTMHRNDFANIIAEYNGTKWDISYDLRGECKEIEYDAENVNDSDQELAETKSDTACNQCYEPITKVSLYYL